MARTACFAETETPKCNDHNRIRGEGRASPGLEALKPAQGPVPSRDNRSVSGEENFSGSDNRRKQRN
jgi:hypothetical protein